MSCPACVAPCVYLLQGSRNSLCRTILSSLLPVSFWLAGYRILQTLPILQLCVLALEEQAKERQKELHGDGQKELHGDVSKTAGVLLQPEAAKGDAL